MKYIVKNKWLYYLIQFTWGLPMNIIGGLVFLVLIIFFKKKPQRFHNCWYIVMGDYWGGVSFGTFFILDEDLSEHTMYHESGHGLQNLVWGPLMPFVICLPSAIRYWYREYLVKSGKKAGYWALPDYDSIWFEGQASKWGKKYYKGEE